MNQSMADTIKKYGDYFDTEVQKGNPCLPFPVVNGKPLETVKGKKARLWAYCEQQEPFIAVALGTGYWAEMNEEDRQVFCAPYAWAIIDAIKRAEGIIKEAKEDASLRDRLRQVCREWSLLLGRLPISTEEDRLLILRAHYGVKYIGTETHLRDAFLSARVAHENHPEDLPLLKNFVYILWDCLEQARESLKNRDLVQMFYEEMQKLEIPAGEAGCYETRIKALSRAEIFLKGERDLRQEAFEAGRSKDYVKAIKTYLELLKTSPDDLRLQTSLAWVLHHRLKELLESQEADWQMRAINIFQQGKHIGQIEKPSLLSSRLLWVSTRLLLTIENTKEITPLLADSYLAFVLGLGPDQLSEEDCQPYRDPETHELRDSLYERLAKALYRAGMASRTPSFFEPIIRFLKAAIKCYPEQEWFPFYLSKMLIKANQLAEAHDYLVQVVRLKRSAFWAWATLAETYKDETEYELACLCQAALCPVTDEKFRKRVHERLQALFAKRGLTQAALQEESLAKAIRATVIKRTSGAATPKVVYVQKAIPNPGDAAGSSVLRESSVPEYGVSQTPVVSDNTAVYKEFAGLAEKLAIESAPLFKAVIANKAVKAQTNRQETPFIQIGYLDEAGAYQEISCKEDMFQVLQGAVLGTPLFIRLEKRKGKDEIFDLLPREEGVLWDIYPGVIGVVVSKDGDKGVSYVMFKPKTQCYVDHKRLPESRTLLPGTYVEIKYRHNPIRDAYTAVAIQAKEVSEPLPFCKTFSGELRLQPGHTFGFIGDVFISSALLQTLSLCTDGVHLNGLAVVSYDTKKAKDGWQAVTLLKD